MFPGWQPRLSTLRRTAGCRPSAAPGTARHRLAAVTPAGHAPRANGHPPRRSGPDRYAPVGRMASQDWALAFAAGPGQSYPVVTQRMNNRSQG